MSEDVLLPCMQQQSIIKAELALPTGPEHTLALSGKVCAARTIPCVVAGCVLSSKTTHAYGGRLSPLIVLPQFLPTVVAATTAVVCCRCWLVCVWCPHQATCRVSSCCWMRGLALSSATWWVDAAASSARLQIIVPLPHMTVKCLCFVVSQLLLLQLQTAT